MSPIYYCPDTNIDPAYIWHALNPHVPDVARIWAYTMLLSGCILIRYLDYADTRHEFSQIPQIPRHICTADKDEGSSVPEDTCTGCPRCSSGNKITDAGVLLNSLIQHQDIVPSWQQNTHAHTSIRPERGEEQTAWLISKV